MIAEGCFSHLDPATGESPLRDMVRGCFQFSAAAENLVRGSHSPEALHRTMMKSRGHRKNMQNPRYELIGVGCCEDTCIEIFAGF
jgi:uncharacterized protein YkwD